MQNPNAIVSTEIRFDPPLDRPIADMLRVKGGLSVELEGERKALLNPDDPRSEAFAEILDGLREKKLPVYVEVDPDTSVIKHLLIPHVSRVVGIKLIDLGVLGVELEMSHGRHILRPSSPDYEELESRLRDALDKGTQVIVTENDAHEIIDVREFIPGPEGPPLPFPKPLPFPPPRWQWMWLKDFVFIWRWCWWPWNWCRCVSKARAKEVFDAMSTTSCDPLTVPAPCIPFMYPDDGCWARAHEMCRLMINMGVKPKKVWIQGGLHVSTNNNPNCNVWWGWHVAPTLCVRRSWPWFFRTRQMVIDPSLFNGAVGKATWKGVQGDPSATLTDSAASIYYLWGSVTDPTYSETNYYLAYYRLQLQNRSIQHGPPPYAHCP